MEKIKGFMTILQRVTIVPVIAGQLGHTWLEFYLLALAASPDPDGRTKPKTAKSNRSLVRSLATFECEPLL